MKTILSSLAAVVVAVGLSGCIVRHGGDGYGHYHNRGGHHHGGVEVVVPTAHIHDDYCGHYYHRNRWYHYHRHRHGPHCGHAFIGGRWVLRL